MGLSIPTYPLAKKYTDATASEMGAVKGAPCEIASIELGTQEGKQGYFITFEWEDKQKVRHQLEKFFPFGQKGDKGDKGEDGSSPTITVKSSTSTEYLLEIDANGTIITTPNLKGAKGADGAKGEKGDKGEDGKDGRSFTIKADYPDMESLIAEHPTGKAGDAYFVGSTNAPDLVVWEDENNKWYNAGQIKGLKGDKGDKGDKGEDGVNGQDGITPQVTVHTQTQTEYKLKIKTGEQELVTPNLRGRDGDGAVDEEMSTTSENALMNKTTTNALNGKVDKIDGKGLSTNDYTTADKEKLAGINLDNYIPTSQKGANGGVAELDANGKIPVSQIPNGFDNVDYGTAGNVVESASGYIATSFTKTGESSPVAPRTDTIYLDTTLNISFMWGGENYISVGGGGVALGETSSTAYRGDRGKIAYDDSQANKTHIGDLTQLETTAKEDLVSAINEVAQSGGSITVDDALDATSDNAVKNKVIKAAVDEKVDKVIGKGLSTNDFTNEYKTQLDNLNVDLTNKQNKTLSQSRSIEDENVTTVEGSVDALKTHTDRAVTDASGAHGFKVTNSNSEIKILYKSGDVWVEIPLGDKTQSSTLPQASASTVGMILQYTGADTLTLTNGYWYKCEAQGTSPETYAWVNKPVMEVEDLKKDTLPPASAEEFGNIYLYTGATTLELQKGFFYECVRDGQNYEWLNIRVQAGGGQTIQYTVMPTAEVATLGKVIQYTGITTTTEPIYKHNYWYECKTKTVEGQAVYYWDYAEIMDLSSKEDVFRVTSMPEATDEYGDKTIQYIGSSGTYKNNYFYKVSKGNGDLPYGYIGDAVVFDGEIHIMGSPKNTDWKKHYSWDGTDWNELSELPQGFNGNILVLNNELHIIFGSPSSENLNHKKWNGSEWVQVSTIPYPRYYAYPAVVYNNEIHLLGFKQSGTNAYHYKWNGTTWAKVSDIPYSAASSRAVIFNNEIHLLGGTHYSGGDNNTKKHYKWNGTAWSSVSELPIPFYNNAATVYNNKIYIFGSNATANQKECYSYNGTSWTKEADMPDIAFGCGICVYDSEVHLLGGGYFYDENGKVYYGKMHNVFDGTSWTSIGGSSLQWKQTDVQPRDDISEQIKPITNAQIDAWWNGGN